MKVLHNIAETRKILAASRALKKTIGLVPTMGALHSGHITLVREAIRQNDLSVVSIFVNPIQFNNPEDLEKYPVSVDADLKALEDLGVDLVFMPPPDEMYASTPRTNITFGSLDKVMEGAHRPGHFNGVAIVVAKLFNIIAPKRAYFGQKDLQQFKVIEQLVQDLSFDIELVKMPIIREPNGLAMSSRNQRLSADGRKIAAQIYKTLSTAAAALRNGQLHKNVMADARSHLEDIPEISIEYLNLVNLEDLQTSGTDTDINRLVLCFAGFLEGVRLIDNVIISED